MKLLHVDASILGANSVSRQLSGAIVKRLREANPATAVTYHDLGAQPLDHLTGAHLAAAQGVTPEEASLQQDLALGQKALEDFLAADIVVVGASRGGFYGPQTPTAFLDHQESYLRGVFGFFGITDVTFIRAEGVNVGPEQRKAAIDAATAEVAKLAA